MQAAERSGHMFVIIRKVGVALGMLAAIVVLMMWLMGVFHAKIGEQGGTAYAGTPVGDTELVTARQIRVPVEESAVGSVRPVYQTGVAAKLLAKVVQLNAKAGQAVKEGEVLVRLDDADLKARVQQATAAVDAARAGRDQAKTEFGRIERLYKQNSAAQVEFDRGQTELKSAEANLQRAEQALNEAQTVLGYATITAPMSGIIVDKRVEVGDTATPGQVLLELYDPTRMQLVASVRESLTHRLAVGQAIGVKVEALDHRCQGVVSEIVPEAEAASRTFAVKVTGPCPPGIYAGMFGRLFIPLDEQEVLVIPAAAVRRIGQLDVVQVADGGVLRRRAVQLGRSFGEDIEVLAGVAVGEQVAVEVRSEK